jgi:hypothetical protein
MDLTKLSTDSLRNICEFLLDEKLVTEEQFLQIATSRPSNELKRTTDYIHACLCQMDHDEACTYYIEEQRTDCWISPSHRLWLDEVSDLMLELRVSSEQHLKQAFKEAMDIVKQISKLSAESKYALKKLMIVLAL